MPPIKRWAVQSCLIIFYLYTVALPTQVQGSDVFFAGNSDDAVIISDYYVEHPLDFEYTRFSNGKVVTISNTSTYKARQRQTLVAIPKTTTYTGLKSACSALQQAGAVHPNTEGKAAFMQPGIDPFSCTDRQTENSEDAFAFPERQTKVTAGPIIGSQTETISAPLLQGATNGTIGPVGCQSNLVVDKYIGPLRIIFVTSSPSIGKVAKALRELYAPASARITFPSTFGANRRSLKSTLELIAILEAEDTVRILKYKVMANVKVGKHRKRCLWAEVYSEEPPDKLLSSLYLHAAGLEKNVMKARIYQGRAALCLSDWDSAWRHFELVYKKCKDNVTITQEVVDIYRRAPGRDLEWCIWLTRYLRIAPDWDSFEKAYIERYQVERAAYDEELKQERGPNLAWDSRRMPLKVCFPDAKDANYDNRLKEAFHECMRDWIPSTGGKIDYVETSDPKRADIMCYWKDPETRYKQYEGSSKAPVGKLRPEVVADTVTAQCCDGKELWLTGASIGFYANQGASMCTVDDEYLRAALLHEVGHALGITKHLHATHNVMYPYISEQDFVRELSYDDMSTIFTLYKQHPINQRAVEKFIGLRAVCKQLDISSCKYNYLAVQNKEGSADTGNQ